MTPAIPRLEPVVSSLPCGFAAMQAEARAEGYRFLDRLAAEWDAGTARFAGAGEQLLAAYCDDELDGIGGLTLSLSLHQAGIPCRVFESVA